MTRHVSPDLGEIGFAGAGFVDQFAVEHQHQSVYRWADRDPSGASPEKA